MKSRTASIFISIATATAILGLQLPGMAQNTADPANNAALQYYSAFLQMQDADLNDADVKELGEIMAGHKPYDEAKFGALVEKNIQAIETMMVGSELPYCEWGLSLLGQKFGPETPVPYFWRSRVLGRLDYLYALRAASQGKQEEAVRALIAGVKFGHHVASGGPLVPALIDMTILRTQLSLANQWLDAGKLNAAQKTELRNALEELGSDGIDWESAMRIEMKNLKNDLASFQRHSDQRGYYKLLMKEDPPKDFKGITPEDYAELNRIAELYLQMFRDSNPAPVLKTVASSGPMIQNIIPNPQHVLDNREALRKAIQDTKARLGK